MLFQILFAIALGILFGTITGLTPGIHINLVGIFLVSISGTILIGINPLYLAIFISSMAITHTFVDFIPSIYLGCPDGETELSVLPGHQLLKQGKGHEAVLLSLYGSIFAILILLIISAPSMIIFPKIANATKNIMPYILIFVSFLLILLEKKKLPAIIVFLLSGIIGFSALNLQNINQPLFPLLTGLFGLPILIKSIKDKTEIPPQKTEDIKFKKSKFIKPLTASLISSPICSFLPGLGSGQAAIIGSTLIKTDRRGFIVLIGATNTLVMGFSFITLYLLSKTRTGAAAAIKQITGTISLHALIIILVSISLASTISFNTTKKISKIFANKINKINYPKLSIYIISFLVLLVIIISGIKGLFILLIASLLGIYSNSLNVRRTLMMGSLMIPTILLYLWN